MNIKLYKFINCIFCSFCATINRKYCVFFGAKCHTSFSTGLIINVELNLVVLIADLTMAELKVLPQDLQLCSDVSRGVDSVGKFQIGDLVMIELV